MNVVYLIQSGEEGAVLVGTIAHRSLRRHLTTLQRGNPDLLTVRILLDGDERLERQLHVAFDGERVRGDWYRAVVLERVPDDARRLDDPHTPWDEERRQAALALAELGGRNG